MSYLQDYFSLICIFLFVHLFNCQKQVWFFFFVSISIGLFVLNIMLWSVNQGVLLFFMARSLYKLQLQFCIAKLKLITNTEILEAWHEFI